MNARLDSIESSNSHEESSEVSGPEEEDKKTVKEAVGMALYAQNDAFGGTVFSATGSFLMLAGATCFIHQCLTSYRNHKNTDSSEEEKSTEV
ncbi:MAG: hypothetical protein K940chlam1_00249 [Candidatus Anoxychlamydiales bacterium]|nr:hypothetical protein [Candidatus Anoxychlamydiales bacterium]NGX35697.1 hypothetical protein [Candidatus Anoxychlamydiales bacterium]